MSNIFNKPIGVYQICSEQKSLRSGFLHKQDTRRCGLFMILLASHFEDGECTG